MIAELRDGRLGAAQAMCVEPFAAFCEADANAVHWVAALEAARGFPHVTMALRTLLSGLGVALAPPPTHLPSPATILPHAGEFGDLHEALGRLRLARDPPDSDAAGAEAIVLETARHHLSDEAGEALVRRWRANWRDADAPPSRPLGSVWGRSAAAYLAPAALKAAAPAQADERDRWTALAAGETLPVSRRALSMLRRAVPAVLAVR